MALADQLIEKLPEGSILRSLTRSELDDFLDFAVDFFRSGRGCVSRFGQLRLSVRIRASFGPYFKRGVTNASLTLRTS